MPGNGPPIPDYGRRAVVVLGVLTDESCRSCSPTSAITPRVIDNACACMHTGGMTDQPDRIAVQARLPRDLAAELRAEAETRGLSVTKLIERALIAYFGR